MDWRPFGFLIGIGSVLAGQAPTDPAFRTTTKLVQVSVVAHDSKGAPVAGLRREEFVPQEIRVFVAATELECLTAPASGA